MAKRRRRRNNEPSRHSEDTDAYGDRCLASEGEGVASNATCTRGVDALHIY